ncbi:MAG: 1-acyl-sn-glycerol-3-phosphate acyltransferase [Actinomycetota bacterium]|nr:1-acyl-sn-glycerol-3-phosphate acyltransferase [Actinomycetota bacterium]
MNRAELSLLKKAELLDRARASDLSGRSKMSKAELIEALSGAETDEDASPEEEAGPMIPIPGVSQGDRMEARTRRTELYDRLAGLVDQNRLCRWRSIEGHGCGLPVVRDEDACALHSDRNRYDTAVPITGRLGFDTWPTLFRHLHLATYDIDSIGLDPVLHEMVWHVLNGLYYDYFRVDVEGIENIPMDGAAMIVANHGGAALPYDAAMLALAVLNEAPRPRRVRVSATEIFNMLPWVSHMYRKVGAVYATHEDARHLLERGAILGVFPEGEAGFMKPVWQAYHVQRFGRGGFVQLAEQTGTPIVPAAILGAEEVHPTVAVSKRLAQLVRFIFPQQRVEEIAVFLNPVPLPVRWRIRFLPPVMPENPGVEPDPLRMLERSEDIRRSVQSALDTLLAARGTAFS